MTTDKTHPATCNGPAPTDARAGVLTAQQIEEIDELRRSTQGDYPDVCGFDIEGILASHRALTAQLRAAEERERTANERLVIYGRVREAFIDALDELDGPALAAPSQRAANGDEGKVTS